MLEIYLISTAISLGLNGVTDSMLKQKNLNEGNIQKHGKISKAKFFFELAIDLIPCVNILRAGINVIVGLIVLNDDELFKKSMRNSTYLPENVIDCYEATAISSETMTDAMILDGADKHTIKRELKQVRQAEGIFKGENKIGFWDNMPNFNKTDYNLAKAQIYASEFLDEIQCNIELSPTEKRKLLSTLRKAYLAEIKGKDNKSNDMVSSVLSKKLK